MLEKSVVVECTERKSHKKIESQKEHFGDSGMSLFVVSATLLTLITCPGGRHFSRHAQDFGAIPLVGQETSVFERRPGHSEVGQVSSANRRVPGIIVWSRSGHGRTMHDPISRPME